MNDLNEYLSDAMENMEEIAEMAKPKEIYRIQNTLKGAVALARPEEEFSYQNLVDNVMQCIKILNAAQRDKHFDYHRDSWDSMWKRKIYKVVDDDDQQE